MIYEYALEPELVATWHDRKQYLFFDEKFNLNLGRIVSAYPKKEWRRLIWEAFKAGPHANDQNAQRRLTELIERMYENAVKRRDSFPGQEAWLERAEAEHEARPFRAIVAGSNPRAHEAVIEADQLIEHGHELWNALDQEVVVRRSGDFAKALAPLLSISQRVLFIDPHFNPDKDRFTTSLGALLEATWMGTCAIPDSQVELHTSIEWGFKAYERGTVRSQERFDSLFNFMAGNFRRRLPGIIPAGRSIKVFIWYQKPDGERLHNRYVLSEIAGCILGIGLDESEQDNTAETDDIRILSRQQHEYRWRQYTGQPPAFGLAGPVFKVWSSHSPTSHKNR